MVSISIVATEFLLLLSGLSQVGSIPLPANVLQYTRPILSRQHGLFNGSVQPLEEGFFQESSS
jgi:hypothetical protein